jgi:5-formyltetrahydrofolate cyclo-ligase
MQESAMTFHRCQLGELVLGHQNLNILEAPEKAQMVMPDMLVIPGLAFSWKGERLGRGKGYYDCYLERYQGIKVALSFSVTTWDELPVESHDQRVDWLITEQGIFDCQRGVWAFDTE